VLLVLYLCFPLYMTLHWWCLPGLRLTEQGAQQIEDRSRTQLLKRCSFIIFLFKRWKRSKRTNLHIAWKLELSIHNSKRIKEESHTSSVSQSCKLLRITLSCFNKLVHTHRWLRYVMLMARNEMAMTIPTEAVAASREYIVMLTCECSNIWSVRSLGGARPCHLMIWPLVRSSCSVTPSNSPIFTSEPSDRVYKKIQLIL
jgi:hypothetical protein